MKKYRKIISVLLTLVMVLALVIPAFAASKPVPGNPAWDVKYKAAKVIDPAMGPASNIPNNPRDNASGDKITSNAHSADFPGLYFYCDDKQKDNGVLLVADWVFDLFVDGEFILTAKNSNNYWGYNITPDEGQLIDGVYAYGISKQIKYNEVDNKGKVTAKTDDLKNINMVFIDGKYKDAKFEIEKYWYDAKGNAVTDADVIAELNELLSFNGGTYNLGVNPVKITDYKTAYYGKKIVVTEAPIEGYETLEGTSTSHSFTVKYNDDPIKVVDFHNKEIKIEWSGEIDLLKRVNGVLFTEWQADFDGDIDELIGGIKFYLYAVVNNSTGIDDPDDYLAIGKINPITSFIEFLDADGEAIKFPKGWYAVVEKFEGLAADVFEVPDPEVFYFYLGETSSVSGDVKNATFMISGTGGNIGEVVTSDWTDGNSLQQTWTSNLANMALYDELAAIANVYNVGLAWVWKDETADPNFHSGIWTIEDAFNIGDEIIVDEDGKVNIYFGADDAVAIWINGKLAAYSYEQLRIESDSFVWDYPFGAYQGDKDGFRIYRVDVFDFLIPNELNTIKIDVMNQPSVDQNGEGSIDGNPSGLLLFFEVLYKDPAINNKTKPVFSAELNVEKLVDGEAIVAWITDNDIENIDAYLSFELYAANDDGTYDASAGPIGFGKVNPATGIIEFLDINDEAVKVSAGWYAIVEALTSLGESVFYQADPLFFQVLDTDYFGEFENTTIPPTDPVVIFDKIPSKQHVDRWWTNFGILAYGASSNTDKGDYYFAFAVDFWEKNDSVTIGFGTNGNLQEYVITLDADGNLVCSNIDFRDQQIGGTVLFDQHHTVGASGKKEKQHSFTISIGAYFDNPKGSGGMQLWLVSIQPK